MNRWMILTVAALGLIAACTVKHRTAVPGPTAPSSPLPIVGITTNAGVEVNFDAPATIPGDKLLAQVQKKPYEIALTDIQRYWVETRTPSTARTIGLVAGVAAAVVVTAVVARATAPTRIVYVSTGMGCCLFVYSWDGQRYNFDTEAYTGAITRGLERDDFSLLQKVREQDGEYRLMLSNDNDETQYTDQLELWVVDQDRGVTPRVGSDGSMYSVREPLPPVAAYDGQGKDLLTWLAQRDRLIWEPSPAEQRQEVVLTFPKPAGVQQAKLVASVTETPWAGEAAGHMLGLLGPQLAAWYQQIDGDPAARGELLAWMAREELFALKIEVEEPTGWQVRGMLPISGPFVSDERVVPLDVSRVVGNQVRIRLRPPAGFWAFNSFAMDYRGDLPMRVSKLEPVRARDAAERDLLPALRAADGQYYEMHEVGEKATVAFAAPPAAPGMERTLFLHSRGYYHMHIPENGEPDVAAFQKILTEPGAGAAFSAKMFAEISRLGRAGRNAQMPMPPADVPRPPLMSPLTGERSPAD
jgi:hypothetical protein